MCLGLRTSRGSQRSCLPPAQPQSLGIATESREGIADQEAARPCPSFSTRTVLKNGPMTAPAMFGKGSPKAKRVPSLGSATRQVR
eukprot:s430_g17.t1